MGPIKCGNISLQPCIPTCPFDSACLTLFSLDKFVV